MKTYSRTYVSHIFDSPTANTTNINDSIAQKNSCNNKQSNSNNIVPIQINNTIQHNKNNQNTKKNVEKFINKNITAKDIKKNQNQSDIFFINRLTPNEIHQLTIETYQPKTKKYISNYNPEKYLKYKSSFEYKMQDLYPNKKYNLNKSMEIEKPKNINQSSRGYNEYLIRFNDKKKVTTPKTGLRDLRNIFYENNNKYCPGAKASDNYTNAFKSNIFYEENKKTILLNTNINLNDKNSINATRRNKFKKLNTSNYNIINFNNINNNKKKLKKHNYFDLYNQEKNNLRPLFDEEKYGVAKAKKLQNNYSVLDNEDAYLKSINTGNTPLSNFEEKEFTIQNYEGTDMFKLQKFFKNNGIHLIDISDNKDNIGYESKNKNIIKIKIRDVKGKNDDEIKNLEKKLKKKYKGIQINASTKKKKNWRLKSADLFVDHKYKEDNKKERKAWR